MTSEGLPMKLQGSPALGCQFHPTLIFHFPCLTLFKSNLVNDVKHVKPRTVLNENAIDAL